MSNISSITIVVFLNSYKQPLTINKTFLQINNLPYESVLDTTVADILDFLISNWQNKWGTPKPLNISQLRTTSKGKSIRTAIKLSSLYHNSETTKNTINNSEEFPQIVLHCSLRPMSTKDSNNYRASLLIPTNNNNSNNNNNNNNNSNFTSTPTMESSNNFASNDITEVDYTSYMKNDSPLYFANDSNRLSTYNPGTRSSFISLSNHNMNNNSSAYNYNQSLSRSPRNDTMSAYTKSLTQRGLFSPSSNNLGAANPLDLDSDDEEFVLRNHQINFSDSVSDDTFATAANGNNNDDSSEIKFAQIIVTDRAQREQEKQDRKNPQKTKSKNSYRKNSHPNETSADENPANVNLKKSDSTNGDTVVENNIRENIKNTLRSANTNGSQDSKCCVIV